MPHHRLIDSLDINVVNTVPVSGGDINHCYKLLTPSGKYFLKVNSCNELPEMFEKEARALTMLASESAFKVPEVIETGSEGGFQFLLMEWIDAAPAGDWQDAGRKLAMMHSKSREHFGFPEDNYIGSLNQINRCYDRWKDFFRECRIMPLIEKLGVHLSADDRNNAAAVCDKAGDLFPEEKPALLHGDLWSGNIMFCSEGPCIFDPAVYFGHREMDLAMTRLFGGFPEEFYRGYYEINPPEKNRETRLGLAQLYPLLVHAVLFGGQYIASVKRVLKKYS